MSGQQQAGQATSQAGQPVMLHDPSAGPGWTGLTIKEILEKVDLFNVTIEDKQDEVKSEKVLVGKASSSMPKPAFKVSRIFRLSSLLGKNKSFGIQNPCVSLRLFWKYSFSTKKNKYSMNLDM